MSELLRYIPMLIAFALIAYPIGRIYKRQGHSPWWGLFALIPLGYIILLWRLALWGKPVDDEA